MRTFTRVANMSPGLRDTGDEIDAAHINELQQAAEDLQTGALPIALAGIEGALGAYGPLQRVDPGVDGASGQVMVWDSDVSRMGWFGGPVLVSSWAPHKIETAGDIGVSTKAQQFLDEVSSSRIPGVLLPGSYQCDAPLSIGSDTTLYLHGADLLNYATGTEDTVLEIVDVARVTIEGGSIDGRKAHFAPTTEYRHGVAIRGSSDVVVRDMLLHHCKGDGVAITGTNYDTVPKPSRHIRVHNVRCEDNHRQGCSLIFAEDVTFRDCTFVRSAGTSPQAGVDIETYPDLEWVHDVLFDHCLFEGCAGAGLSIVEFSDNHNIRRVRMRDCRIIDNHSGVFFNRAYDTALEDCVILGSETIGLLVENSDRTIVRGGEVSGSGKQGVYFGLATHGEVNRALIDGTVVQGNGTSGSFSGIYCFAGAINDLTVTHVLSTGNTGAGFVTDNYDSLTAIDRIVVVENDFRGNAGDAATFGVTATNAVYRDNAGVA